MKKGLLALLAILSVGISSCEQGEKLDLKIMSYNIKHGEGMDGVYDLSRSAAIIKAQAPDLCAVQEVDQFCTRTDSVNQTMFISKETLMQGIFGKFMDFQGGEYGLASFTAKPLIAKTILPLPDGADEPRSSVILEVELTESCNIAFANVHFDYIEDSPYRLEQAKKLVAYLNVLQRPTIITGDFNCVPSSATMKYFEKQGFVFVEKGKNAQSFQGDESMEIDHVIYRNTDQVKFNAKNIELLDEPVISDHRPLVATLEVSFY